MLKLLIAADGSEHADRALQAAGRLARDVPDLKAVLLNVLETSVSRGGLPHFESAAFHETLRLDQDALLKNALETARSCGLESAVAQAAEGPPATEIARVAAEHGVDQIVIGTHIRGALADLLMGSVAQRVVRLAAQPVLLISDRRGRLNGGRQRWRRPQLRRRDSATIRVSPDTAIAAAPGSGTGVVWTSKARRAGLALIVRKSLPWALRTLGMGRGPA